jgi:hypothetical protein
VWTEADRELSFTRVSTEVSELPAAEAIPWRQHLRLSVRGKGFGYVWNDHHGNRRLGLSCKAAPGEQQALIQSNPTRYFLPEYDGARGWVGAHLDPPHEPDWSEIAGLLREAWRMTAPKALVRQFESPVGGDGG